MIRGDTPSAACFNSPEEVDYRTPPHDWYSLMGPLARLSGEIFEHLTAAGTEVVEGCRACGAMRKIPSILPKATP
jgi:hypothetical protein